MNKVGEIIINLLTLGIPAIIKAIQEGGKAATDYWYKADKHERCVYAKKGKCAFACHCMESEQDCKKMHCSHAAG